MSDTPRTDKECKDIQGDAYMRSVPDHGDYVGADFARQLERELASVTKGSLDIEEERDELDRELQDADRRANSLMRELAEANHRIRTLIEQRDGFRIQADHKWRLREEFEALLGTSDVATGVERVKQLKHALSLVVPKCDYLDHPKKCQHQITEPCPVEELIRKAQNP